MQVRRWLARRRPATRWVRGTLILFGWVWIALPGQALGSELDHPTAAGDTLATVPGALQFSSTFHSIGVQWFIEGDTNLDCTVIVQFRNSTSGLWQDAQPLLRVEPGSFNEEGIDPGNLLAGSLFGLDAGTEYELRLELTDPDGGTAEELSFVSTRDPLPIDPSADRILHVVPGEGGGTGTIEDPFLGIAAADAAALPGDRFLLAAGEYLGKTTLTASGTPSSPIVWRGAGIDGTFLNGERNAKPVLELLGVEHVFVEHLRIERPRQMAVQGTSTTGCVIRNCFIDSSVPSGEELGGIYFQGAGHRDAVITDNIIRGPLDWADGRDEDCYALVLVGTGHVVRYNEIFDWWDGVVLGGDDSSVETSNCDVYRNEIYNCTDDGVEADASRHNVRFFENRITNVLTGISCQPVYGGPVYFVRNVIYNFQALSLKLIPWPTGMIFYHNTFVGADRRGFGGGWWRNGIFRNNVFIGGSTAGHQGEEPIALRTIAERADLDYQGWYQAVPDRFAELNEIHYPTLQAFQESTGMETHGVLMDITSFVQAEEPPYGSYLGQDGYYEPYLPGSQDLRLLEPSPAVDAGQQLANINEGHHGDAPDLGAYEFGQVVPIYGPGAGDGPVGVPAQLPTDGKILQAAAAPNPFRDRTILSIDSGGLRSGSVEIYSATGRRVRVLESHTSTDRFEFIWDGRSGTGRQVESGVYYYRLTEPGRRAGGTVLRIQ